MLLLLIVGKWLLPRGSISLDEHSQLLLIYFGLSFDILDLFTLFEERQIIQRPEMVYVVLVIFTLSLFQFTIVFTVVRRKRPKLNPTDEGNPCVEAVNKCCMSELWSLTSHILLHDGPYMVLRLHCLIAFKIATYSLIFFTVKNVLVVALEVYRSVAGVEMGWRLFECLLKICGLCLFSRLDKLCWMHFMFINLLNSFSIFFIPTGTLPSYWNVKKTLTTTKQTPPSIPFPDNCQRLSKTNWISPTVQSTVGVTATTALVILTSSRGRSSIGQSSPLATSAWILTKWALRQTFSLFNRLLSLRLAKAKSLMATFGV